MFTDELACSTTLRYHRAPPLDSIAQYLANAAAREQLHPSAVVFTESGPVLQPLERIAVREGMIVLKNCADLPAWVADFSILDCADPRGEFIGVRFELYQLVRGADATRAVRQHMVSDPMNPPVSIPMRSVDPITIANQLYYARTALRNPQTKKLYRRGARVSLSQPAEGMLGEFYTYIAQGWR